MRVTQVWKQRTAFLLSFALLGSSVSIAAPSTAEAAKKVTLTPKKVSVTVGKTAKLKLKNNKKKVTWKIVSGKKCITLKSKKKTGRDRQGEKGGKGEGTGEDWKKEVYLYRDSQGTEKQPKSEE